MPITHRRRSWLDQLKYHCPLLFKIIWIASGGACSVAHAVGVEMADRAEVLQRRQEQELEQLRARAEQRPDVMSKILTDEVASDAWIVAEETPCFLLHEVRWTDDTPPAFLKALASTAIVKCVGLQGLKALQAHLADRLNAKGLITAWVWVPEQSLSDGVLTLSYLAGKIDAVHSEDAPGWWRMALPTGPGGTLDQRDLDQALENIRRLRGQADAHIDIVPGAESGDSDVLIRSGSGKRWHAYLGADNAGLRSMGREQMSAGVTLDSPLFLYDQLSMSWNSSAGLRNHANQTRAASINYNIPFGYWSVFAGAGLSRYRQTVAGFIEPIIYGGATRQLEAGVSVVPYRTSHSKNTIMLKALRKHVTGTLNDIDIEVQRRDVTGYELGYQHRHYLGRAVLDVGAGVRGTIPKYSTRPGYVYGDPGWNGRATILAANAGVYLPFTVARQQIAYQANWQIQHAKTPIVPADYFTIGDRYTVRGFDGQNTLAAEDGWSLRNELSWTLGDIQQQLYVGLDVGRVGGPSAQYLSGRTLAGAVTGLRGRISVPYVDASYDLSLGRPLRKPESFLTSSIVLTAALLFEF